MAGVTEARADLITFSGDTAHSAEGLGNFSASLSYAATSSSAATLSVALTNTTPSAGGYLTAFALNNPGGITGVSASSLGSFQLLGLSSGGVSAPPLGSFDFGAAVGDKWLGTGKVSDGIAVGTSKTFTFNLTGTNLNSLTAASFANALNGDGYYFAARFRGEGISDKVPAGVPGDGSISSVPEPLSLIPWAIFGLGLLVYALRQRRQPQPAVCNIVRKYSPI